LKAYGILAIGFAGALAVMCIGHLARAGPAFAQSERTWVGVSLPSRTAKVGPEQSGVIVEMPKAEGERVAAGDVLFRLSSEIEVLNVEGLEALVNSTLAVDKAQRKLEFTTRVWERLRKLMEENITSDAELQERQFALAIAQAEYDLAVFDQTMRANKLKQAKIRLAQRTVRSPLSGLVTKWHKQPGEPANELEPVIEVASLDPLLVTFDCPVRDQRLFGLGDEVMVAPALEPYNTRTAKVVFVSMQATPSSHTFRIRLSTANPEHDWKAGLKMLVSLARPGPTPPGGKPPGAKPPGGDGK
jgi:RND family efflux transporter MFP subunit